MSNVPCLSALNSSAFNSLETMSFPGDEVKPLSPEKQQHLEKLDKATQNSLFVIHGGLRGIGQMMLTMATEDEGQVEADVADKFDKMSRLTMMDIATLIEELADTADSLTYQQQEIEYIKRQQASINIKTS